jgi:hypothetical protein
MNGNKIILIISWASDCESVHKWNRAETFQHKTTHANACAAKHTCKQNKVTSSTIMKYGKSVPN